MLLRLESLRVRFGGVEALSGLDLALAPGQVLGLMGPNGCGKTTLFNTISGLVQPDAGRIVFRGADVTGQPPHSIARAGIARTFQTVRLFPLLTVGDNVASFDTRGSEAELERILEAVDLGPKRNLLAGELTLEEQRRLEIARAIARAPSLVLMDEPTAGLNPRETDAMASLIRRLVLPTHAAIISEHKGDVIAGLCRSAVLLNRGRVAAQGSAAELFASSAFRSTYLGIGN